MTNHIHLIARPNIKESLAKSVGRTNFLYTQYINRMHRRSGHLWQNRFYSCPLGRGHFWQALRYVEQNPLRASMVNKAWEYTWSSAVAHVEGKDDTGILNLSYWRQISSTLDWRTILQKHQPKHLVEQIRINTHTGRPLASDSFISKIEKIVNRRLRPLPVGRPKKEKMTEK